MYWSTSALIIHNLCNVYEIIHTYLAIYVFYEIIL